MTACMQQYLPGTILTSLSRFTVWKRKCDIIRVVIVIFLVKHGVHFRCGPVQDYSQEWNGIFRLPYLSWVSLKIQSSSFTILGYTDAVEQPLVPKDTTPSKMGIPQSWKIAPAPESPPQVVLPFLPAQNIFAGMNSAKPLYIFKQSWSSIIVMSIALWSRDSENQAPVLPHPPTRTSLSVWRMSGWGKKAASIYSLFLIKRDLSNSNKAKSQSYFWFCMTLYLGWTLTLLTPVSTAVFDSPLW